MPLPLAEPLPLMHSWPIAERTTRFDLGRLIDAARLPACATTGRWHCRLPDDKLTWNDELYRLFGFPTGTTVTRRDALACYREASRAAVERLRAHAIRHQRGFTIDAEIAPAGGGGTRWIRLAAVPVIDDRRVIALEGVKIDVTALYR